MRQEEQQLNNDHPEAVRSAPVAVPPNGAHRDVPDDLDRADEPTDRDRVESADRNRPWDGRPGDDDRDAEVTDPAPVPTAFGATSVGGAVAASALASRRPEDEIDPREERTAAPGDGAVDGEREGLRADPTAEFDRTGDDVDRTDLDLDDPDTAAQRGTGGHRADDLDGRIASRDLPGDASTVDTTDVAAAGGPGYGSAAPTMVDPDGPSPTGDTDAGSTVPASAATLFDETTAQGFRDRWRDVQLRFVDDPQAAAGQAQSLVDEAMQALSAALAEHKDKLGGWQEAGSPDTEQLRVAVRGYRDFLDRVLGR
ncbi:hypothetical protein ABT008_00275 [Micromonospora sp. NPDC002389]|uniref:hypothetical protein n=1 Tax=Micromonospora sp. NPDC002389 TaxID=3154272 RepID=UPI00331943BB